MERFIIEYVSMDKRLLIISFCLALFASKAISQQKDSTFQSKNAVYADFSTQGAFYSINFDRIFYQNKKINLSYRFGLSVLNDDIAFPLGINLFTGKKNSHLDFSLVIIPYIFDYKSFLSSNDLSDKCIYVAPGIGYRHQKPSGGFFFRVLVSPMLFLDPKMGDFWNMDPTLYFAANMGIGLTF